MFTIPVGLCTDAPDDSAIGPLERPERETAPVLKLRVPLSPKIAPPVVNAIEPPDDAPPDAPPDRTMFPPCVAVLEPPVRERCPACPLNASPTLRTRLPVEPARAEPVLRNKSPLPEAPEPLCTVTEPLPPFSEFPDSNTAGPLAPELLDPLATLTAPETPPAEAPLDKTISPEPELCADDTDAPVPKLRRPLR